VCVAWLTCIAVEVYLSVPHVNCCGGIAVPLNRRADKARPYARKR
jgi:hypothetical protein